MSALENLGPTPSFEALKMELLAAFKGIEALDSLAPSARTNEAFSKLIALITAPFANLSSLTAAAALDPDLLARDTSSFIKLCATSEAELETYWAKCIVKEISGSAVERAGGAKGWPWSWWRSSAGAEAEARSEALSGFPYLDNYAQLVSLEYHLLASAGASFRQTLFIGSGPLPLSSLLLARDFLQHRSSGERSHIINVDQDAPALHLGAELTSALLGAPLPPALSLALPDQPRTTISFLATPATKITPTLLSTTSLLILAALVGLHPSSKTDLLLYFLRHLPSGAHLLLRSVDGLRRFVYPQVDEEELLRRAEEEVYPQVDEEELLRRAEEEGLGVRVIVVAHPRNEVVNSVLVLQRV